MIELNGGIVLSEEFLHSQNYLDKVNIKGFVEGLRRYGNIFKRP